MVEVHRSFQDNIYHTEMPRLRIASEADRQKELFMGVTLTKNKDRSDPMLVRLNEYRFYAGPRSALVNPAMYPQFPVMRQPSKEEPEVLVALKRIPNVWEHDLKAIIKTNGVVSIVGSIEYRIPKLDPLMTAFTYRYYPRWFLEQGKARKVSYFQECITTHLLKLDGIEHISTTDAPKPKRVIQLEIVGLPINEATRINRWLAGMGRGIRYHIEDMDPPWPDYKDNRHHIWRGRVPVSGKDSWYDLEIEKYSD